MTAQGFGFALSRRSVLQLTAGAGLALLAGCRGGLKPPELLTARGTLPKAWQKQLPSPWISSWQELEEGASAVADANELGDLLALSDGWLDQLPPDRLQAIQAPSLSDRLGPQARRFLAQLGEDRSGQVLPVGVSPWVMLFRNGAEWIQAAHAGWEVLLHPSLTGKVVLPASPRWVMALVDRLGGGGELRRLRGQLLTMDDRRATNWLLKGDARVVVLPLQRCMALLRRDPRLTAVLPESGSPLHWTLLLRPEGTREPLPQKWVEQAWNAPLRQTLLRSGWLAPLNPAQLKAERGELPAEWRDLLVPSEAVWQRCWSLPPLQKEQRIALQQRWRSSAP
ncbi:MAG: ABC transporter substrate-binding protein [Cyanobacteriota bacterium]|nr:ABC transporter substrate-binding protein [Cyanobacteriota bacterium]